MLQSSWYICAQIQGNIYNISPFRRPVSQMGEFCRYQEHQTWDRAWSSLLGGSWEVVKSIPTGTTYHGQLVVSSPSPTTLLVGRLSGLQWYSMGHNGHGINLYGVIIWSLLGIQGDILTEGLSVLVHREGKWSFITDHSPVQAWSPFTTCRVYIECLLYIVRPPFCILARLIWFDLLNVLLHPICTLTTLG